MRYAGASGDFNPMHHDDTVATSVGNPSVFGHGMLTAGLMARVVKDWFGPEAIRRFQVRFAKQVWPGDTLTCSAKVTGKREDGGDRLSTSSAASRTRMASRSSPARRPPPSPSAAEVEAMGLLDGRVAVVTGSGRGIGREFALCMASEGASIVINDVGVSLDGQGTDEDPAAQVCKEIEALGSKAVPNYDSVTDFDGAARIVQSAVDAFGKLDILVNNAGIVRDRTLVKMSEDDFDAVLAVHLKGSFNSARHAAPVMKEAGYGRIINITSSGGAARQLRSDQLRRGEGRAHGSHLRLGARARTVRDHGERRRAGGGDPDDRRTLRPHRHGAATRAEPRAQRAAGRVPRL